MKPGDGNAEITGSSSSPAPELERPFAVSRGSNSDGDVVSDSRGSDPESQAEELLRHVAEFTGLRTPSACPHLSVDFKIALQAAEYMAQQTRALHEVKCELGAMRDSLANDLKHVKEDLEESHQRRHDDLSESLHTKISDSTAKMNEHITQHHEALHGKIDVLHGKVANSGVGEVRATPMFAVPRSLSPKDARTRGLASEKAVEDSAGEQAVSLLAEQRDPIPRSPSSQQSTSEPISMMQHLKQKLYFKEKDEGNCLRMFLQDHRFEWSCAFVIIVNAGTIGYSAQEHILWALAHPGVPKPESEILSGMAKFFLGFYTIELLLKLWVWRCDFFIVEHCKWNIFDLVLVLAGWYDLVTELSAMDLGNGIGVTWLRVLRIVKTLKLLRVIRVMRFFKVLRMIMSSISGSLPTLFWSLLMINIMLYIFGLCFLNAVTLFLNENKAIEETLFENIRLYWSSVPQAMMTLFWAVSGGADWEPLAAPIRSADDMFYLLFFFYVAFAAFAVFNILTGMFVMQADEVAQADEENVAGELLQHDEVKVFRKYVADTVTDHPGTITHEIVHHEEPHFATLAFMKAVDIGSADLRRVFGVLDCENCGRVDLEEFLKGCCRANGALSGLDMVLLMNETKHTKNTLYKAMTFLEERLDEMVHLAGADTHCTSWQSRIKFEDP